MYIKNKLFDFDASEESYNYIYTYITKTQSQASVWEVSRSARRCMCVYPSRVLQYQRL